MIDSGNIARWHGTDFDLSGHRRHPTTIERPDLVGHVCVWGPPGTPRMLLSRRYTVEGPLFAESNRYSNITIAAMEWTRPDMVRVLVGLRLQPVDPLKSDIHSFWESDEFPRRARTTTLADAGVTHSSLVPPLVVDGSF